MKSVDDFDRSDLRFPDGYGWEEMLFMDWVDEHQDFVFHGPTGRGKTRLAIALGVRAVANGKTVRFATAAQLVLALKDALERGKLSAAYDDYRKVDVLVVDELCEASH